MFIDNIPSGYHISKGAEGIFYILNDGKTYISKLSTDGKINLGGMGASTYYKNNINLKKLLTEFQADNTIQVSARKSTNNNPELKTKGENDE